MEIERKYLLDKIPFDLSGHEKLEITQAYISTDPHIRLRRSNSDYFLTFKESGQIARVEVEKPITKEQYEHLWTKVETKAVDKDRYIIPLDSGLKAELDVYKGELDGLLTVEVEFESLDDAMSFTPPDWFGKDVSEDYRYKNTALALYGLPNDSGAV
jgi:CYTH domain-containing protein